MNSKDTTCHIGVIGLGVMGQNLALNFIDHGYQVAGYDVASTKVKAWLALEQSQRPENVKHPRAQGFDHLEDLLAVLPTPRVLLLLVPAGELVDQVCESLLDKGLAPDDILVDCGNSAWTDSIRREHALQQRCHFFCTAVSGGEVGARFGPSLMPSGSKAAWQRLKPMWEAIAAKVDSEGRPMPSGTLGKPQLAGEPCTAYLGPNGAGHYVKMIHNGIEYADMQLICEAYQLLRSALNYTPQQIGKLFEKWNKGKLNSYLIEISADILQHIDLKTGQAFVDVVLDSAGQKGTGRWTAITATDMGVPAGIINEAVYARALSSLVEQRHKAARCLQPQLITPAFTTTAADIEKQIENALYSAKICTYAQGFQILQAAQEVYGWAFNFADIAKIWRGGCIIRARFLQVIADAYQEQPDLDNLLFAEYFTDALNTYQLDWRNAVILATQTGVSIPSLYASLAYFDGYRANTLPANLLQAQRDYFGAHTYQRKDANKGQQFHTLWQTPNRHEIMIED